MAPGMSFTESVQLVCREALRAPWIGLTAWRGCSDEQRDLEAIDADSEPVLVLGGFLSHPYYYAPLGRMLARRGYAVHFDDVFNARPLRTHIARLRTRVDRIVQASGSPLRLVGHSLGGIQAMVLLLEQPDAIGQVVAVASPVVGGTPWRPLQRLVEHILRVHADDTRVLQRRLAPYVSRITTISSPHDLVAPPAACTLSGAANVVLTSVVHSDHTLASHGGVIFMRAAVRAIMHALSDPLASRASVAL